MLYRPKCHWIVLFYIVHVTTFSLGGGVFPDTVYNMLSDSIRV